MLVSGSTTLNILLANNNKVISDVLKEADAQTLENIIKQDPKVKANASEVIKELFQNIKDGTKSTATIENILKNSAIFKELGSVSTNLVTLSNMLQEVENSDNLAKFKPLLENLSKNIKDLDATTLKEQIKSSGVFLENKIANTQNPKLENILKDIQSLVKTVQTPLTNQIDVQINKILQDIQNPKSNVNQSIQNQNSQTKPNLQTTSQSNTSSNQTINNQTPLNQSANQILTNTNNINQPSSENQLNKNFATSNNPIQVIKKENNQVEILQTKINTQSPQIQNTVQQNPQTLNLQSKEPILKNPLTNDLKVLTQNLQKLSENLTPKEFENLSNLTKELKTVVNQASLVESKFENISTTQQKQSVFNQANQTNQQNQINSQQLNQNIQPQVSPNIQNPNNQVQNLQQNIFNAQTQLNNINTTLVQNPVQQTIPNQIQSTQAFLNQIQNQIKENTNPQIINQNQTQNIQSNLQINQPQILNQSTEEIAFKEQITNETKQLLVQIKDEIVKNPNIVQNKNILPIIDNLLKMENLFVKNETLQNSTDMKQLNQALSQNNLSTFSNNFASNLSPLLNNLKESLNNLTNPNISNIQTHLTKTINRIEHIISNTEIEKENKISSKDDMKTLLLELKEELSTKTDAKSSEILKQVDKILTQIDFYQLNSLILNSNHVYVPFFWEMLEDGSINIKKTEEDKFYCQINLTLKDFGKVDLMLGLYDKNKMDLTIYAQRDHFKTAIKENIKDLKLALNNVDIIPVNIKLLDMKENLEEDTPTSNYLNNSYNQSINSGIDIKV